MDSDCLRRLWAQQPGRFICLSTKERSGRWQDHFFADVDLKEFIATNRDKNCYFAPMKFDVRARKKEHAVLPRMLWADLDQADPHHLDLEPTIAIKSSPGRYAALWATDGVVTEDLNRRLTYHVGADKSGWDVVQVLRLPGSRNLKYASKPQARVLWEDGPIYKVSTLERRLPVVPTRAVVVGERKVSRLSMTEILDKYDLNDWLVRELLGPGRRTNLDGQRGYKVHWRMACELHDAGVPRDEGFVLLFQSKWNKHASEGPVWSLVDKIWGSD